MRSNRLLVGTSLILTLTASLAVDTFADDEQERLESIHKIWQSGKIVYSLAKAKEKITREDEYYIGRAVAAMLLTEHKVYDDAEATEYVNLVGRSLTLASDLPEVFSGYHFIILDSDEVNAFAAPGAFVFITRGILRYATDEDMLAAVLAHEIGHIQRHHGRELIREKRWQQFWNNAATAAASSLTPKFLRKLTAVFNSMSADLFTSLIQKGYSKQADREADADAVALLKAVGYDPHAMIDMFELMDSSDGFKGRGFARTHPEPRKRIRLIEPLISVAQERPVARQERFKVALARARGE